MQKVFLIGLFILVGIASFGQSVKVRAYVQSVSPGIVPKGVIDENGNSRQVNSVAKEQYLIYLLCNKKLRVIPVAMWLNGEAFAVNPKNVETPVMRASSNQNQEDILLIPKTTDKVVQLLPIPMVDSKIKIPGEAKVKINEVVVVYKKNGKFYTAALKKLIRLEPILNE